MKRIGFVIYSCILGIGSALVGLVVGLMIEQPSAAVASILVVIGLAFLAIAIFISHRSWKRNRNVGDD